MSGIKDRSGLIREVVPEAGELITGRFGASVGASDSCADGIAKLLHLRQVEEVGGGQRDEGLMGFVHDLAPGLGLDPGGTTLARGSIAGAT